jgi:hypothetical protein
MQGSCETTEDVAHASVKIDRLLRNARADTRGPAAHSRLSQNVVSVDPDSLTMAPSPMSRSPNVIRPAHVITSPASVIRPIANLDGNGARVSGISWTVARAIRAITSVIWSVSWITAIIPFTSRCTDGDKNKKEQKRRPLRFRFRFIPGKDDLRVINDVCFHNIS